MISRKDRTGVAAGDFPLVEAGDNRLSGGDRQSQSFCLTDQRRRDIGLADAGGCRGDEIFLGQAGLQSRMK